MKLLVVSTLVLVSAALTCKAEPLPDALVGRLTTVVREHCPDATIEATKDLFTAKHGTMMFTRHGGSKTGEILSQTHQEEGPNFKGFVITVGAAKGFCVGQADNPQELRGPYYSTYIDAPLTEDGKNCYTLTFSYGSRLDPKFKQAIFDAIPKRKFQQDDGANGSQPFRSETNRTSSAAGSRR